MAPLLRPLEAVLPWALHSTCRVQTHGLTLRMDARTEATSEISLSEGTYELEELEFLQQVVSAGGHFLDVGANVGVYTCLAARWVGPTGRVVGVEPDRLNARLLKSNIRRNCPFRNATFCRAALHSHCGTVTLYRSLINCGDHRTYDCQTKGRIRERVRAMTADRLVARQFPGRRVDVIKMDVQGSEGHALAGMRQTLLENRDHIVILMEWWPYGLRLSGTDPRRLLTSLHELGLKVWNLAGSTVDDTSSLLDEAPEATYQNVVISRDWRW